MVGEIFGPLMTEEQRLELKAQNRSVERLRQLSSSFIILASLFLLIVLIMGDLFALFGFTVVTLALIVLLLSWENRLFLALHVCGSLTVILLYFLFIIGSFVNLIWIIVSLNDINY